MYDHYLLLFFELRVYEVILAAAGIRICVLLCSGVLIHLLAGCLHRLLEHLQTHYAEELSLDDAAEKLSVSKYHFTRVFRRYTGQTFNDYLTSLRIRAAEDLLKQGSIPVSEICALCGYASFSSFNRNFRKLKGCSPTEFRQLYQKRYSL